MSACKKKLDPNCAHVRILAMGYRHETGNDNGRAVFHIASGEFIGIFNAFDVVGACEADARRRAAIAKAEGRS